MQQATCRYCGNEPATTGGETLCNDCASKHLHPDHRFLRSPDGKHLLNARSYVPNHHDKLEHGRTYTLEELQRDYGMPRLSKNGIEPHELQFIVEKLR